MFTFRMRLVSWIGRYIQHAWVGVMRVRPNYCKMVTEREEDVAILKQNPSVGANIIYFKFLSNSHIPSQMHIYIIIIFNTFLWMCPHMVWCLMEQLTINMLWLSSSLTASQSQNWLTKSNMMTFWRRGFDFWTQTKTCIDFPKATQL